jgi:t-SNARE complex subunit (syntaxin)
MYDVVAKEGGKTSRKNFKIKIVAFSIIFLVVVIIYYYLLDSLGIKIDL